MSYLPFFLIFQLFTPELSSIPVSPLSPPLSLSSSVHIPLFMLRHTLCLHLLLAIYSSPYLSTHPFLTFPSPLLSPSPNPIPLSTPLSISFPQEMVSFPKKGGGGMGVEKGSILSQTKRSVCESSKNSEKKRKGDNNQKPLSSASLTHILFSLLIFSIFLFFQASFTHTSKRMHLRTRMNPKPIAAHLHIHTPTKKTASRCYEQHANDM